MFSMQAQSGGKAGFYGEQEKQAVEMPELP